MESLEPCKFLDWDTKFFGRRIASVEDHQLDPQRVQAILDWCRANAIKCLYFLADSNHPETVRLAEDHGFRFVDIRVTLRCDLQKRQMARPDDRSAIAQIRLSCPSDIPSLETIAGSSHTDSRFYYDPGFPKSSCNKLYETWIRRSCAEGFADAVLVAEMNERAVGYVTCRLEKSEKGASRGQIGLVGVAADVAGQGIGRCLVNHSLDWFAQQGAEEVIVVTQGRNIAAQRLYQSCGFRTQSVHLWYHKWVTDSPSGERP